MTWLVCDVCGGKFEASARGRPRTTCSPGCRRQRRREQKREERSQGGMIERQGRCAQCGRVVLYRTWSDSPPYVICEHCR